MTFAPGTRLGAYEIVGAIAAGGMGEVFRAHDARLDRDVAIKVLPAELAQDRERLARFEREAKLLASLNHPNIAHVYGFESASLPDGSTAHFLAMELVQGDDLSQRLKGGAIPVDEAIAIAKQIAEGLEEAHEHGIIHRDLKPANIKVTPDGKVKILDFGLAKALEGDASSGGASSQLSHSPTISRHMTEAGMIMGTAAYMSPEQARGKPTDKRADIWAFGVVLHEMLTGERLFAGETVSDVLAGVLKTELHFGALPAETPPAIRRLLRACLERNPKNRLHDIADARLAIDEALSGPGPGADPRTTTGLAPAPTIPAWRRALPWGLVGALLVLFGYQLRPRPTAPAPPARLEVRLTPGEDLQVLANSDGPIAVLSPDGQTLVYLAASGGSRQLYVRRLDQLEATPLAGTEDAEQQFFSPDGGSVAFFAKGRLMRASLGGGAPTPLAPAANGRGGTWGPDDTIVFAADIQQGLSRVSAAGGPPASVTTLGPNERTHRWPSILPGGTHVLFGCQTTGGAYDDGTIEVARIDTGERKLLIRGGTFPRYVDGYLLYSRGSTLYAVRFDLSALEVRGKAQPVLSGLMSSGGALGNSVGGTGAAQFSIADNGNAAYLTGATVNQTTQVRLAIVDRSGRILYEYPEARLFRDPRLSPDGRQIAVRIDAATGSPQLYLLDTQRGTLNQITFDAANAFPVWSSDGRRLAFASLRNAAEPAVYLMPSDGSGESRPLTKGGGSQIPTSFSPDDRLLAVTRISSSAPGVQNQADIEVVSVDGGTATPFLNSSSPESVGQFSPDGKWMTFMASDSSGIGDVYVRSYPGGSSLRKLSTGGGMQPHWTRNGREIVYVDFEGHVTAVDVSPEGGALVLGNPHKLFDLPVAPLSNASTFDAAKDGSRFVILVDETGQTSLPKRNHVTMAFNFLEELRRATAEAGK